MQNFFLVINTFSVFLFYSYTVSLIICLQVPQRIEQRSGTTENISAGTAGVWGNWGPWSACSRSCSGGVMEQTRPCLPANYHERSFQGPSHQYSAAERTSSYQNTLGHETALNPYSGHVLSAIRTSVPLHRNVNTRFSPSAVNDFSHLGRGTIRGNRHPLPQGQTSRFDRRYLVILLLLTRKVFSLLGIRDIYILSIKVKCQTAKFCVIKPKWCDNKMGPKPKDPT